MKYTKRASSKSIIRQVECTFNAIKKIGFMKDSVVFTMSFFMSNNAKDIFDAQGGQFPYHAAITVSRHIPPKSVTK